MRDFLLALKRDGVAYGHPHWRVYPRLEAYWHVNVHLGLSVAGLTCLIIVTRLSATVVAVLVCGLEMSGWWRIGVAGVTSTHVAKSGSVTISLAM
jgi:hypothetical protein